MEFPFDNTRMLHDNAVHQLVSKTTGEPDEIDV
jgi:hypothetical protein